MPKLTAEQARAVDAARPGYGEAAPHYQAAGWQAPLPLPPGRKADPPKGTTGRYPDPDPLQIRRWQRTHADGNVALRLAENQVGIDVDDYDGHGGGQTMERLEAAHGDLPPTAVSTSRYPDDAVSGIRYFRLPDWLVADIAAGKRKWHDQKPGIEVIHHGHRYAVVWPSTHPDTGNTYRWFDERTGEILDGPPQADELPVLPDAWTDVLCTPARQRRKPSGGTGRGSPDTSGAQAARGTPIDPARSRARAEAALREETRKVHDADEGTREGLVNEAGLKLGHYVGGGWLDQGQVVNELYQAAVHNGWAEDEDSNRGDGWALAHIERAVEDGMQEPDPGVPADSPRPGRAVELDDEPLTQWLTERVRDRVCWAEGLGWLQYDDRRGLWDAINEQHIVKMTRDHFVELLRSEMEHAGPERIKSLAQLKRASKILTVARLLKSGLIVRASEFDQHHHLLNVGNGVVDLRTGELRPHDPALRFTKGTPVEYVPGAEHRDWEQALTALPAKTRDWMQVRFGQAATGLPPSDDLMIVMRGGGENGKTTVISGVAYALGGFGKHSYAGEIPERALMANPSDHPTELTTLRGLRMAIIEEAPGGGKRLSVQRLKQVVGKPTLTARQIGKDNITWEITHTLFLTTNYQLRVEETDHGTWRRLRLVRFPYKFTDTPNDAGEGNAARKRDTGLRQRVTRGRAQREAVLAWVVEGAMRWYRSEAEGVDCEAQVPAEVNRDTEVWRRGVDLASQFADEFLEPAPDSYVLGKELFAEFDQWVSDNRHERWSDTLFVERFESGWAAENGVVKKDKTRTASLNLSRKLMGPTPKQASVWQGVRWRADKQARTARCDPQGGQQRLPGGTT